MSMIHESIKALEEEPVKEQGPGTVKFQIVVEGDWEQISIDLGMESKRQIVEYLWEMIEEITGNLFTVTSVKQVE